MRPQYNGRALRAVAALGAAVLVVGADAAAGATDATSAHGDAAGTPTSGEAASPGHVVPGAPATGGTPGDALTTLAPTALSVAAPTSAAASAPVARTASVTPTATMARMAAASPSAHGRRRHRGPHAPRRLRLQATMLHRDVLIGQDLAFVGRTRPGLPRRLVGVQQRVGTGWTEVARTRTDGHGRFLARFWPRIPGHLRLRLRLIGHGGTVATAAEPGATVFHQVVASWYGPGGMTACGQSLGVGTLGVANRTLPCGTKVTLRYQGRTVTVPVIDRGPFVAGRDYDLTYATKLALGAGDITVLWASA